MYASYLSDDALVPVMILLLAACDTTGRGYTTMPVRVRDAVYYAGPSANFTEGRRAIVGSLSFEKVNNSFIPLKITDQNGTVTQAMWPIWADGYQRKLSPTDSYRVELLSRYYGGSEVLNDVLRLSNRKDVVIDASVCHVHRLPMQRQIEHVTWVGAYPPSFFTIQLKNFPNDGNAYLACPSGIRHPKWRCTECNRQYHIWTKRHGVDESY